jgi:hypothetical protein
MKLALRHWVEINGLILIKNRICKIDLIDQIVVFSAIFANRNSDKFLLKERVLRGDYMKYYVEKWRLFEILYEKYEYYLKY